MGLLTRACDLTDRSAWDRLVTLYEPLLHGWLRRHGVQHADAEDLVQAVLSTLASELPTFDHNGRPGAFRCWLRGILTNRLRDHQRSQRVRAVVRGDSELLDKLATVMEDSRSELSAAWDHEHDRFVARRLLGLIEADFQPTTWRAFWLVAVDGREPETVASEMGMSVESVYTAKSRVLKRLRDESGEFLG
jgi:RNA polymerase sigma-70 factor (ECF subfamily)